MRHIIRRCCCKRNRRVRTYCRRNRKIRETAFTVRRGQSCVRKVKRTFTRPRCGPKKTTKRICRGRKLTIIRTTRRLVRCRCYVRRRVIRGYCRCPRNRVIRRCNRGRFRVVIIIRFKRVGIRCVRTVRRKARPVICKKPYNRRFGCNRRTCRKTTLTFFSYVRGCRCRVRRSRSVVACCKLMFLIF